MDKTQSPCIVHALWSPALHQPGTQSHIGQVPPKAGRATIRVDRSSWIKESPELLMRVGLDLSYTSAYGPFNPLLGFTAISGVFKRDGHTFKETMATTTMPDARLKWYRLNVELFHAVETAVFLDWS